MACFNFIGEVDCLSERQLEFITSVLQELGYKYESVSIDPVGQKGDNYVANVLRFTVQKKDGGKFTIVAKVAPKQEVVRMMLNTTMVFNNEVIMYTEVLPKFVELQKNARIPEQDWLKFPKCYGTLMEQPDELVLLEDLNESNYGILGRLTTLNSDNIKLVLKNLANHHSCSYYLKQQDEELYNTYCTKLVNPWILVNRIPDAKARFKRMEDDVLTILDDDMCRKIIPGKMENMASYISDIYSPEQDSKYFVIQQGDCWTNNLMFKSEGGKIIDNIMIDYQISKQSSPVDDLLYLIFNCTDYVTRKTHYHDWLDYYYSNLSERLHKFGLDAETVYPKTEMLSDLKRNAKFVIGQGFMLATVLSREQDEALNLTDAIIKTDNDEAKALEEFSVTRLSEKSLTRLRSRIKGLVDSYAELGLCQNEV